MLLRLCKKVDLYECGGGALGSGVNIEVCGTKLACFEYYFCNQLSTQENEENDVCHLTLSSDSQFSRCKRGWCIFHVSITRRFCVSLLILLLINHVNALLRVYDTSEVHSFLLLLIEIDTVHK